MSSLLDWLICLHFIPLAFSDNGGPQLIAGKGCFESVSSLKKKDIKQFSLEIFIHFPFALNSSLVITQVIFNKHSQTFAGAFKLATFCVLVKWILFWSSEFTELISGWQAIQTPIYLADVEKFIRISLLVTQAIIYPGIPQMISEEDEGDL